jgi:hypothetical protein
MLEAMGINCLGFVNISVMPAQSSFIVTIAVIHEYIVFCTVEAYVYGRNSTVPS